MLIATFMFFAWPHVKKGPSMVFVLDAMPSVSLVNSGTRFMSIMVYSMPGQVAFFPGNTPSDTLVTLDTLVKDGKVTKRTWPEIPVNVKSYLHRAYNGRDCRVDYWFDFTPRGMLLITIAADPDIGISHLDVCDRLAKSVRFVEVIGKQDFDIELMTQ
jgi:hypothetical protein